MGQITRSGQAALRGYADAYGYTEAGSAHQVGFPSKKYGLNLFCESYCILLNGLCILGLGIEKTRWSAPGIPAVDSTPSVFVYSIVL